MWEDRTLYWAWTGQNRPINPPPTRRRLDHALIESKHGEKFNMLIACTVYNDGIPSKINRKEIEWYRRLGANITMGSFP